MKYTCLLALIACCFTACVTTSLPQVIIPARPGQVDASLGIGCFGLQTQGQISLPAMIVLGGAGNINFGPGPVQYGTFMLFPGRETTEYTLYVRPFTRLGHG